MQKESASKAAVTTLRAVVGHEGVNGWGRLSYVDDAISDIASDLDPRRFGYRSHNRQSRPAILAQYFWLDLV